MIYILTLLHSKKKNRKIKDNYAGVDNHNII